MTATFLLVLVSPPLTFGLLTAGWWLQWVESGDNDWDASFPPPGIRNQFTPYHPAVNVMTGETAS